MRLWMRLYGSGEFSWWDIILVGSCPSGEFTWIFSECRYKEVISLFWLWKYLQWCLCHAQTLQDLRVWFQEEMGIDEANMFAQNFDYHIELLRMKYMKLNEYEWVHYVRPSFSEIFPGPATTQKVYQGINGFPAGRATMIDNQVYFFVNKRGGSVVA